MLQTILAKSASTVESQYVSLALSFTNCIDCTCEQESTSAIAAVLTILQWTRLSGKCMVATRRGQQVENLLDAIGRRPVILIGALGHITVYLLFGLSRPFTQIIALRALGKPALYSFDRVLNLYCL
jgi:hypothetical protein